MIIHYHVCRYVYTLVHVYRNVQETYFDIVRILVHTAAAAAYLTEWCQCVVDVIWRRGWGGGLGGELTQLGEGRGEGEGEERGGGGIYISNTRYLLFKVVNTLATIQRGKGQHSKFKQCGKGTLV